MSQTPAQTLAQNLALKPALELAQSSVIDYPGESAEYRRARTALLAEEIEMRRQIERVAALRRALPPGGRVPQDYSFESESGPTRLSDMFNGKDTLVTYNFMYGPQRERPCPMCTSLLGALDGEMADILQRTAFAVIATSPIERLVAFKRKRGWRHLKLYCSAGNGFNLAYAGEQPGSGDNAALNVFVREGSTVRHFWGDEMGPGSADPGQDARGAANAMPLWSILDLTPQGRGTGWYPSLSYTT